MGLFKFGKKKLEDYKVIKLYKVVTIDEAKKINIQDCALKCLDLIYLSCSKYPNIYSVNFGGRQWKSKRGFISALAEMKNIDIVDLEATFSDSRSSFYIDNNILNYKSSVPLRSIVTVELAIPSLTNNVQSVISIIRELYAYLQYDYGYCVELNEGFDFGTERRVKKSILGNKVSVEDVDTVWRFHSVGIKYGFLKNVYPINVLNKAHMSQPILNRCILNEFGTFELINDKISLWILNSAELSKVKKLFEKSKYLISNKASNMYFLDSEEAKQFYSEMKFN